jgi:Zn-dependent M28 family amino/carboxypeptidase
VTPIPAGALSLPDAEQLQRILKRGKPVTMKLTLTPRNLGMRRSGNVVAEVPGTDKNAGIVLIGGHLDSWDLGTGAFDNAAGVGITTAAAKRIMEAGKPRRTIRVVWFGAEEVGGDGAKAYRAAHANDKVVFVSESDFGADRVWRYDPGFAAANAPLADRLANVLAPLGIARSTQPATAGADLGAYARAGVAVADLQQDGTRYFDFHHTPDDTLDKVDREQLRQNVAAWTAMLSVVANAKEEIAPTAVTAN